MHGVRAPRIIAMTSVALVIGLGLVAKAGMTPAAEPVPSLPGPTPPAETPKDEPSWRAFSADSWWNARVPADAAENPAEAEILDYLSTGEESGGGCLTLAGAGDSPWGQPIYWAEPGDPVYDVRELGHRAPPELHHLRMPEGARPAANNDGTMIVFDRDRGYVVALTNAAYDEDADEWSATGATVTYLDSNGLHARTGRSDDPRNVGTHRGNNGATMAVRWDEVQAGAIRHVLKIAAGPEVADRAVFPMIGSDGDYEGDDPAVPPQGLRLRLKPSVDLAKFHLHPQALVIARALQDYGVYIGDSGGRNALKLENPRSGEGRHDWQVTATELCGLPFDPEYWDVLAEGYDPSPGS